MKEALSQEALPRFEVPYFAHDVLDPKTYPNSKLASQAQYYGNRIAIP